MQVAMAESSNSSPKFIWMSSLKVWIHSPGSTATETSRSKRKILDDQTDYSPPERRLKRFKQDNFLNKSSSGCPICLGDIDQSQFAVLKLCMHQFCLKCIETWSTLQRKCPLCKRHFDGWFYDIQGSHNYREKCLLPLPDAGGLSVDRNGQRHSGEADYQRTLQYARGQTLGSQRCTRPLPRRRNFGHSRFLSSVERRRFEEERAAERAIRWRASIYKKGLRAIPPRLKKKTTIRQNVTGNLAEKARLERRMEPWIHRELEAILGDQDRAILFHLVFSLWFSKLKEQEQKQTMDLMCNEYEFIQQLEPFLGDKASLFWHELRCFAESPFTINAYDSVVEYQSRPCCKSGE